MKQTAQGSAERREPLSGARLWRVELDVDAEAEAELREALSADELARVDCLVKPAARRRFVVARGALRGLLGDALGESPESVPIEEDTSGKPRLAGGDRRLWFNVSHSGDLALICLCDRGEVGVDLEELRPVPSALAIARRRFSRAEMSFVERGKTEASGDRPSEVDRRFLLCWTRKEAAVKAVGAGLDFDLRGFSVPLAPEGGIVEIDDPGRAEPQCLLLADVPLGAGHVGALALLANPGPG